MLYVLLKTNQKYTTTKALPVYIKSDMTIQRAGVGTTGVWHSSNDHELKRREPNVETSLRDTCLEYGSTRIILICGVPARFTMVKLQLYS